MNKKAKTKAQKAVEDANLDEAPRRIFPGQRPSLDDSASDGSRPDAEKTEETSEGTSNPTRDKAKPCESDGTVAFTGWQIWSVVRLVTSTQIWPYQNRQVEKSESSVLGHLGNVGGSDAARRLFELRNARASQFFAKEQGRVVF